MGFLSLFDHKTRYVALKKYRFLGLTPDPLIQSQGAKPRNLFCKKSPPMGPTALGLLKHDFEIIRHNSGNSWEEEQSQSQKLGGRVPKLFLLRETLNHRFMVRAALPLPLKVHPIK